MPHQLDYISMLARQPQPVFHTSDLGRLWNISNKNTLYTLLTRLTQKNRLIRIYKGLYSLLPIEKLDPLLVGIKALHNFAYVSTETVLITEGVITQIGYHTTLISSYSRRFQIGRYSFISRRLKDRFLYNPAGIFEKSGILQATLLRAVADLLYFNPRAYFDNIKSIDFTKLRAFQKEIGYPITRHL